MYSIALGVRCFKWKMLSLSGPKALLFLQLFIAFITRSVLNVRTISNGFLLISLVTTLVSLEEVCLPSFEVFNSTAWSGLSFGPWFQQSLHVCRLCTQIRFWMVLFNLGSSGEVESLLRRSSRLFITSSISAGTGSSWSLWRPVRMWCDTALSRTVRKIFSSLWQSIRRERLLRAASTSCLYLSQLAFLGSYGCDVGLGWRESSYVI